MDAIREILPNFRFYVRTLCLESTQQPINGVVPRHFAFYDTPFLLCLFPAMIMTRKKGGKNGWNWSKFIGRFASSFNGNWRTFFLSCFVTEIFNYVWSKWSGLVRWGITLEIWKWFIAFSLLGNESFSDFVIFIYFFRKEGFYIFKEGLLVIFW